MKMLASMKTREPSSICSSVEEVILVLEKVLEHPPLQLQRCPAPRHGTLSRRGSRLFVEVELERLSQEIAQGFTLPQGFSPGAAKQGFVENCADLLLHGSMMARGR